MSLKHKAAELIAAREKGNFGSIGLLIDLVIILVRKIVLEEK
jgi:hypothetical protein